MISRGEVGLDRHGDGRHAGIFNEAEVAVMVAVVLLTTLITPLIMRGAFAIHCPQDVGFFLEEEMDESPDSGDFPM